VRTTTKANRLQRNASGKLDGGIDDLDVWGNCGFVFALPFALPCLALPGNVPE
jgi:hypothetical protein